MRRSTADFPFKPVAGYGGFLRDFWHYTLVAGLSGGLVLYASREFAVVALDGRSAWAAILVSLFLAALWLIPRFHISLLSPGPILALSMSAVGLAGLLLSDSLAPQAKAGALIRLPVDLQLRAAAVFAVCSGAAFLGAVVSAPRQASSVSEPLLVSRRSAAGGRPATLVVALASPLLLAVATDAAALFHRDGYILPERIHVAAALGQALSAPAVVAASYLLANGRGLLWRFLPALGLFANILFAFSGGSRRLALIPGLVLMGFFLAGARARRYIQLPVFATVVYLTLVLLNLPLLLRAQGSHGFLPYIAFVGSNASAVLTPQLGSTLGNLLFSFPLTGFVAFQVTSLPHSYLWVAVNPLPGGASGWTALAPALRVNAFTPYNGLGELANQGFLVAAIYFFAITVILHRLQVRMAANLRTPVYANLAAVGVSTLLAVTLLQYNLRSGTRFIYYFAAFVFGTSALRFVRSFRHGK